MQTKLDRLAELLHDEEYYDLIFELVDNELVVPLIAVAQAAVAWGHETKNVSGAELRLMDSFEPLLEPYD